ncbi:MAG: hypothetical protein IJ517_03830 [Alphaproteobacteria bacterium]|nr:hypothetical protein [Alphaproteobacteria bacterium]
MNAFLKKTLIETILKSDVEFKRDWGSDFYTLKDASGKVLAHYVNGYDYGLYRLTIGTNEIEIEWYENSKTPKTQEQKDMFEVLSAFTSRWQELNQAKLQAKKFEDAKKALTAAEQNMINVLTGKNQKVI